VFEYKRLARWLLGAEPLATPMELALWPGAWREVFRKRRRIPLSDVKRFVRTNVGDGLELFSADKGAKTLIVAFTTRTRRIFMPAAVFLQHLDDRKFDVLVLYDFENLHFDRGTGSCNSSFAALLEQVRRIARSRGYTGLITYGTSMGGFPALRAGHILRADRAISAGGSLVWHVTRLRSGGKTVQAFDPICECSMPIRSESYVLYSEENAEDVKNAERVSAVICDAAVMPVPTRFHDFPFLIYKLGRLAEYHRQIFDLSRKPDHRRLRKLFAAPESRDSEASEMARV
jgi:hypothetical protein